MLQNCVFIFLKFLIDLKEIANDINFNNNGNNIANYNVNNIINNNGNNLNNK